MFRFKRKRQAETAEIFIEGILLVFEELENMENGDAFQQRMYTFMNEHHGSPEAFHAFKKRIKIRTLEEKINEFIKVLQVNEVIDPAALKQITENLILLYGNVLEMPFVDKKVIFTAGVYDIVKQTESMAYKKPFPQQKDKSKLTLR